MPAVCVSHLGTLFYNMDFTQSVPPDEPTSHSRAVVHTAVNRGLPREDADTHRRKPAATAVTSVRFPFRSQNQVLTSRPESDSLLLPKTPR